MKKDKILPAPKETDRCGICGEPVHASQALVASRPRGARYWAYAHAECLRPRNRNEVRK